MKLTDKKITLRPAMMEELETFTRWMNDPEVTRYLGPIHEKNISLEDEKKWLSGVLADPDEMLFSIFTKAQSKLVGNCAIHLNAKREDSYAGLTFLGLAIGEKVEWGKGYGTSAIQLMLEYLIQNSHKEVYLTVDEENQAAQAVYKKCGFELVEKRGKENDRGGEHVMKITF